jgi:tRNA(Arg) A34 adenosine deaminase TadA
MRAAIDAARRVPTLPFGAVLVRRHTGDVVAVGVNRTDESPTFHAEVDALNRCAAQHPGIDWSDLDLYTTAEPCPMCQGAIEFAGVRHVYYGASIPWLQAHGWWQIDIRAEEVARRSPGRGARIVGGLLEAECTALFEAAGRAAQSRQQSRPTSRTMGTVRAPAASPLSSHRRRR